MTDSNAIPPNIRFAPDEQVCNAVVQYLKSQGLFDKMRRECLSDIDTKPAFSNLNQRIEGFVDKRLSYEHWTPNTNKIQLREKVRRSLAESDTLKYGINHLVNSAVESKVTGFKPQIEDIVVQFLGLNEKPELQRPEEQPDGGEDSQPPIKQEEDNSMDRDSTSNDVKPDLIPATGHGEDDREEIDMDVDEDSNSNSGSAKEGGFIHSFKEIEAPQMSPGYSIPTETVMSEQSTDAQLPPSSSSQPSTPIPKKPFTMQINLTDATAAHIEATDGLKFEQPIVTLHETSIPETLLTENDIKPEKSNLPSEEPQETSTTKEPVASEPSSSSSKPEGLLAVKLEKEESKSPKEPPSAGSKPQQLTEKRRQEILARVRSANSSKPSTEGARAKVKRERSESENAGKTKDRLAAGKGKLASAEQTSSTASKSNKPSGSSSNKPAATGGRSGEARAKKEKRDRSDSKADEVLSDVSSVHTSDLSDFSDQISSDEDEKKLTIVEPTAKAKPSVSNDEKEQKKQALKERKAKSRGQPQVTQRYDASDLYKPRPSIGASRRRRNLSDD